MCLVDSHCDKGYFVVPAAQIVLINLHGKKRDQVPFFHRTQSQVFLHFKIALNNIFRRSISPASHIRILSLQSSLCKQASHMRHFFRGCFLRRHIIRLLSGDLVQFLL